MRKTFDKVGQKFDEPDELDCSRLFYESLLKQNPASAMAEKYCLEHGLLDDKHAKDALARPKGSKPTASSTSSSSSSSSAKSRPAAAASPAPAKTAVKREAASPAATASASKPKKTMIIDDDDD